MSGVVQSILDVGSQAIVVDVECHISNGLPNIIIVGFANKAIDESKERIRSAFANSKLELPKQRITINLAPADMPKDSTSFDVPIAIAILQAANQIPNPLSPNTSFIGELGLDGKVRSIRGIIGKLLAGRKQQFSTFYVPADNLEQASLVPDITIIPVRTLKDLYLDLTNTRLLTRYHSKTIKISSAKPSYTTNFKDVIGQARAKRAFEIAAAGGHNILVSGTPGTGKSMLAKALPSILPPMSPEEVLEVSHLHSLADKNYSEIIVERPFRSPHHSASNISIVGGGQYPRPGEITLAHQGILLFDEFPEFGHQTLEALRQPLEDKVISVARARDNIVFPANFMLVATCNPCPCGYYGSSRACTCLPHQINKYRQKLSGPILDRIDLYVDVDEVKHRSLLSNHQEEQSSTIQQRVMAARKHQLKRYKNPFITNATLSNKEIKQFITISAQAKELLNQAAEQLGISARSYMRIIKVAQTIADLTNAPLIDISHITEALQYRHTPQVAQM